MVRPDADPPSAVGTGVDSMGIGIIGVGGVGLWAHLPAYRRLGLPVVAVHDLDVELARRTAEEYRVPSVARSVRELVHDDRVRVIDLATPPSTHVELMALAATADKPVLVQKPLVIDPAQLADVTRLRAAGARVRLNMTGRYVSAWVKVAELLREGAIGRPFLCTIRNRDWWDREPDRWDHDVTSYIVHEMLIHHLDLCLLWFGGPARVAARVGSHPRQRMQQANWAAVMLEYDAGPLVQILEDWTMGQFAFAQGHPFEEVLISGEDGVVRATSERVELSRGDFGAIEVWHLARPGQRLASHQLTHNWFPDSFGQAMQHFLESLQDRDAAARDWRHLLELTSLAFSTVRAATASAWVEPRSGGT